MKHKSQQNLSYRDDAVRHRVPKQVNSHEPRP